MENNIYKDAKIVVVDDVEEVLKSTKNCLEFEDMQVICFQNPIEGLEYLKQNKADVLLLDFFMPEMNGDEFVEKLREYNNETIVILQTGYSDKIPPLEMIDRMNIQGYLDKLKGEDELVLMTKAAIKTSFLNKQIREKDKEIAKLSYKKAITGNLITNLVNEAKDQVMQISLMNESISQDTEEYKKQNEVINNAVSETYKLYEALNFEYIKQSYIKELKNIIEKLLKPTAILNSINISFDIQNENEVVDESFVEAIYFIIKAVQILSENEVKQIVIKYIENKRFIIEYDKNVDSSKLKELEILNIIMKIENNSINFNI